MKFLVLLWTPHNPVHLLLVLIQGNRIEVMVLQNELFPNPRIFYLVLLRLGQNNRSWRRNLEGNHREAILGIS